MVSPNTREKRHENAFNSLTCTYGCSLKRCKVLRSFSVESQVYLTTIFEFYSEATDTVRLLLGEDPFQCVQ